MAVELAFTCNGCGPVPVSKVQVPHDHIGNFYCPNCGYDCLYEHERWTYPNGERPPKALLKRDRDLWFAAHWRALWTVQPALRATVIRLFWSTWSAPARVFVATQWRSLVWFSKRQVKRLRRDRPGIFDEGDGDFPF